MANKCSVVMMYETQPKPLPLGWTHDERIKVLVKRQLLKEAEETLRGAEALKDEVLIASFQASLDKLRNTLDLLIPPELEELYIQDNGTDTH